VGPRQLLVDNATGDIQNRGDAVGGNLFAIGTAQLDVPLPLPESYGLGSALFVDFGTVGLVDRASRQTVPPSSTQSLVVRGDPSLGVSAGFSVFWDWPFGPFQFDFGEPLEYEPYDRRQEFRFSTRTSF